MHITYAITVCNEADELRHLLSNLFTLDSNLDIVVQIDSDNGTDEVRDVLRSYDVEVVEFPLSKDFASFKNNLKSHCHGEWIFQIDADEYPHSFLVQNLYSILELNKAADLIAVPRINTVEGITQRHIDMWRWSIAYTNQINHDTYSIGLADDAIKLLKDNKWFISDENDKVYYTAPVINFPDYQTRILRNKPNIKWQNKVHEVIVGYEAYGGLPAQEQYCLYHPKKIDRQERQNQLYSTIN